MNKASLAWHTNPTGALPITGGRINIGSKKLGQCHHQARGASQPLRLLGMEYEWSIK